jgi:hypothetical protein
MNKKKLKEFEINKRKDQTQYISNQVDNYIYQAIDYEIGSKIEKIISGEVEIKEDIEITIENKIGEIFKLIKNYIVKEIRKEKIQCNL